MDELEKGASARLTVIDVNVREQPSKELFKAILGRVESKKLSSFLTATVGANPGLVVQVQTFREEGNDTCILVDEANSAAGA